VVATGALAAEYVLHKGSSREMAGKLRARARRARARSELQRKVLRRKTANVLAASRSVGPHATFSGKAFQSAMVLAALALVTLKDAKLEPAPSSSSPAAATRAPAPVASEARTPESLLLTRPFVRPSLLILAMVSCDTALREYGMLGRVAVRQRVDLTRRARVVTVPRPLVITGKHVRHALSSVWDRLSSIMAQVPRRTLSSPLSWYVSA
jgi:hypothetical protein